MCYPESSHIHFKMVLITKTETSLATSLEVKNPINMSLYFFKNGVKYVIVLVLKHGKHLQRRMQDFLSSIMH